MDAYLFQEIIKIKYNLNAEENLHTQSYNSAAIMIDYYLGVATRIQEKYLIAVLNYCPYHSSSLPMKAAF